jgi:hypothetical protein
MVFASLDARFVRSISSFCFREQSLLSVYFRCFCFSRLRGHVSVQCRFESDEERTATI